MAYHSESTEKEWEKSFKSVSILSVPRVYANSSSYKEKIQENKDIDPLIKILVKQETIL